MIRNSDVCLRAVRLDDLDILYKAINNPDLVKHNASYSIIHETEHLKWFERLISDKTKAFFMIDFENHPVGSAQLIDIHPVHKNAEITIRLFEENNFGKQIGSQALSILCDYGFNNLNLHRLWLRVFHDNERAIRVYKKNGFNEEGLMKEAAFIQGVFKHVLIMGKIRND